MDNKSFGSSQIGISHMKQGKTIIRTTLGDITKITGMDAIVNAANHELSIGTGGVNLAIHKAAGHGLSEECNKLNGCVVGEAKITSAYKLPCKYIIHSVGPVWVDGHHHEDEDLRRCYKSCLEIACKKHIRRIAFPSIATGLHYLPLKLAAHNAIKSVGEYVASHPDDFDEIVLVLYTQSTKSYYDAALAEWEKYIASKIKKTSEKSDSKKEEEDTALSNNMSKKPGAKISIGGSSTTKEKSPEVFELHCLDDMRLLVNKDVKKVILNGSKIAFPVLMCPKCNRYYTSVKTSKDSVKIKLGDTIYTNLLVVFDKLRLSSFLKECHVPDEDCKFYPYQDKLKICPSCKKGPFQKRILSFISSKHSKQMNMSVKYCQFCDTYYMHYSAFKNISNNLNIINPNEYMTFLDKDKVKEPSPAAKKSVSMPASKEHKGNNINIRDFVVRRTVFKCTHSKHKLQDITGSIDIVNKKGIIENIKITAGYCPECKVFFILESTYAHLKHKGIPLCRIISEDAYLKSKVSAGGMNLAPESILMQYGYSVSQKEDLSDFQRQKILSILIDNKIMTKSSIISYLDFFILQKKKNPKYEKAISRWQDDREYVSGYKIGSENTFVIKGIHVKH